MKRSADVRSIDALRDAKAALIEYRETIVVALSEANSEVQRALWWVQNDQRSHWERELRRRTEQVNQAKSELYRAKLSAMDDHASCLEQRKALERAERRLEMARRKIEAVKHWSRVLDREFMLFKGQLQAISRVADSELPLGIARLEMLDERLRTYLATTAPSSGKPAARSKGTADAPPTDGETT